MKKVLLTIIFMFVCGLLFVDNANAYEVDYGLYYDDTLGFWTPAKVENTSNFPTNYTWFGNSAGFEVDDANKTVTLLNANSSMSGPDFFRNYFAKAAFRTESGSYDDLSETKKWQYNAWESMMYGVETVTISYDYSDIIKYYNLYGVMPEYIYVTEDYDTTIGSWNEYMNPLENIDKITEYFFDVDLGEFDPIKGWAMIIDFFCDTCSLEESYVEARTVTMHADIIYSVDGFDFSTKKGDNFYNKSYIIALNPYVDLNQCQGLTFYLDQLNTKAKQNKDGCYSLEFKDFYNELDKKCDNYIKNNVDNDTGAAKACKNLCKGLSQKADEMCNFKDEKNKCGIGSSTMGWFMRVLKILRYIVPVLVIILSILDFITAIASGEEDALKKAGTKFAKRIVAAILVFLLPAILQFLFDTFKINGLSSNNPYCMK